MCFTVFVYVYVFLSPFSFSVCLHRKKVKAAPTSAQLCVCAGLLLIWKLAADNQQLVARSRPGQVSFVGPPITGDRWFGLWRRRAPQNAGAHTDGFQANSENSTAACCTTDNNKQQMVAKSRSQNLASGASPACKSRHLNWPTKCPVTHTRQAQACHEVAKRNLTQTFAEMHKRGTHKARVELFSGPLNSSRQVRQLRDRLFQEPGPSRGAMIGPSLVSRGALASRAPPSSSRTFPVECEIPR